MGLDEAKWRDAYRISNMSASQRARWCADDPGAEPNTCRYCGRHWRKWTGSKLDGHAACVVTADFKQQLAEMMRSCPDVTFLAVARALGVSPAVVQSWTYPIQGTILTRKRGRRPER